MGLLLAGSDGVTLDNVLDLLVRIRRYSVPVALEVSTVDSVTPGFDYYFIPTVLNSTKVEWINGIHHAALREYGHMMDWDEIHYGRVLHFESRLQSSEIDRCDGSS